MRVPKHLLNTTDVRTCRNGVKTYHGKILNGLISYSGHISHIIFLKEPLFFIIQDCVHERKALFYLKIFICKSFHQFDKCPGKYTSNTCQVETKPVCK